MSELPITKDLLDLSVRCTCFFRELKNFFEATENITDAHFIPVIKGYEVKYINRGVSEKLYISIKNRFYSGLIIKKYVDGKFKKIYFAKDGFAKTVNRVFQK